LFEFNPAHVGAGFAASCIMTFVSGFYISGQADGSSTLCHKCV